MQEDVAPKRCNLFSPGETLATSKEEREEISGFELKVFANAALERP